MADSYEQLRKKPKDTLVREYDGIAQSTQLGLNFYRDEIARRDAEEQSQLILSFTKQMRDMTIAITVMTGVVVVLTIVNVYLVWPK
ncbi:hypothetical protein ASD52_02080 [Ensifer sp. Root142]|uniref:hypothetical protein n=1 Tax=Ensifer sp. Root142 TaxID=1736461 RepID=UPI00070DE134|nr:hypothetical protein [Ensifer sp. Root142]KQY78657.1 hypothetical protein ASD52_02080 [Ensifer sp. Root142]